MNGTDYCGGLVWIMETEVGDPVASLWIDRSGVTVGTAKGRLVSVRFTKVLNKHGVCQKSHPTNKTQPKYKFQQGTQRKPLFSNNVRIRHGQAYHLIKKNYFEPKYLTHDYSYIDFFRGILGAWTDCPDRAPTGIDTLDTDMYSGLSSTGPGGWSHLHIPFCRSPDSLTGIYAAHNSAAYRAIYETDKRLYALSGNNRIHVYDRFIEKPCERNKMENSLSQTFIYTCQSYRTAHVFIGSDTGALILDLKNKTEQLIDWSVRDTTLVPVDFDGHYLLCAVNTKGGRSIRIYNLFPSLLNTKLWPDKPVVIHTIDIGLSIPLAMSFWRVNRILLISNDTVFCYKFDEQELLIEFTLRKFRETPVSIFGGDAQMGWVLTQQSNLYGISGEGTIMVSLDVRPARVTLGYPVKLQLMATGPTWKDRIFVFNGDGGIYMGHVGSMMSDEDR